MARLALAVVTVALLLAAPSALGASGADNFRLPSGNIFCAYEHYNFAPFDLRCEIRSGVKPLPRKPADCHGAWGAGYSMEQRGTAGILCITDTIYTPKARVLTYGQTKRFGVFTCSSSVQGLRCVNASGNGFFMSRAHSYAFKR
jgi:hypothetical protein